MLKKQYFRMEMKEGTSMEVHIKNMKELTDRLVAIKAPIAEEDQVMTLLGSLPSRYSTLVTALEARDNINLSYVQQSLVCEEQRLKEENKPDGSMDARSGTGWALVGKQDFQKGGGHQHKRCATCVERLDIFVGIVPRIIIRSFQNLNIRPNLLVWNPWFIRKPKMMRKHLQ